MLGCGKAPNMLVSFILEFWLPRGRLSVLK
jgi:hypothetical protein